MAKIIFENAVVSDNGYGLEVNGKSLEEIISMALGTKAGSAVAGYSKSENGLKPFYSNSCNVTVIIEPNPNICVIENLSEVEYESVEELESEVTGAYGEHQKKAGEAES